MTILIDGNNLLHRELNNEKNVGGTHSIRMLYNKLSMSDDLTVVVWDGYNGNARRKEIYPAYKGNRPKQGEDVYAMFKLFQELLDHTSVMQIKVPTWEADDVIYTLAKFFAKEGDTVSINTNDADYLQMAHFPGISLPQVTKWEWDDRLICAYKALVGDTVDNIPGMPGYGKGSWKNCQTYHQAIDEALRLKDWDTWKSIAFPKFNQRACLDRANFDQSAMFYEIITLKDVPIDDIVANSKTGTRNDGAAEALLRNYML
jgi:5'-3' exonuclease